MHGAHHRLVQTEKLAPNVPLPAYPAGHHLRGRRAKFGDIGAGGVTKLANQIIVAANIAGLSEALVLAQKAGVDPERVFNAIRGGLAGSAVMEAKGPMMLDRNFRAGFRIRLHQKDLNNALAAGKDLGVSLPFTGLIQQILGALVTDGKGDQDHSGIVQFIESMAKVEVKKAN